MARRRRNRGGGAQRAPRVVYVQAPQGRAPARPGVAARRRRRRARLRANRGAGGLSMVPFGGGGMLSNAGNMGNPPVALKYSISNAAPRIVQDSDGIVISHRQRIATLTGSATGAAFAVSMNPCAHGWTSGLAHHFQHYSILDAQYSFVSRVSTASGGTVVMAPYYLANHPNTMLGQDPEGMFDFLRDLPGVKEFAVWASDSVGVVTTKFTRQIFRTLGVLAMEPASFGDRQQQYMEDQNPGWLLGICTDLSGSGGRESGELWVEYRVRFSEPKSQQSAWVSYNTTSTSSSALALNTAQFMGDPRLIYPVGTNTFRVGVEGLYTMIVRREGTNPLEDKAAWDVFNFNGDTRIDSAIINSVVSGAFAANTDADNLGLHTQSATSCIFVVFLRLYESDSIVVPALTSGTITRTTVHFYKGGPSLLYES